MLPDGRTVGLALSGGGFRATLFGLGSVLRLNEAGLLGRLDRVSSVSGGSILAGLLARRWNQLQFANGTATNLTELVTVPLVAFCRRAVDVGAGLRGAITPFRSAGDYLAAAYDRHLFGGITIRELPIATPGGAPRFVINATNLQTGRLVRFRQDFVADWSLGKGLQLPVPLARAVAASSAFPPVFSPVIVKTDPGQWVDGTTLPEIEKYRRRLLLTDGGVYDNLGLETLLGSVDVCLVSDAGAPFTYRPDPPESILQMGRVRDILIDQTRALRKRWLIAEFDSKRVAGGYWGIGTQIDDYNDALALVKDNSVTNALADVPTRLAGFGREIEGRLINWGYALADVALRQRVGLTLPPAAGWPRADASMIG